MLLLVTVGQVRAQLQRAQGHLCRSGMDHIVLCLSPQAGFVSSVQVAGGPDRRTEKEGELCLPSREQLSLAPALPAALRGARLSCLWGLCRASWQTMVWRNISGSYVEILQETQRLPLPVNEHEIQIPFFFSDSRVLVPNAMQLCPKTKFRGSLQMRRGRAAK